MPPSLNSLTASTIAPAVRGDEAGTPRRRFFAAVALFLAVTGTIKLVGVLLETRVLAAPDPVVPIASVRQMTFAAALLELGVARLLWRSRDALTPALSLLWLVGVFATYRFCLWAIGFRGHCNCLGHLFDWVPGFAAWGDRAMLASLVVMALGSVWHLRSLVSGLRVPAGGTRLLLGGVVLLANLPLLGTPVTAAEIEGRMQYEVYDGDGVRATASKSRVET